ncbi:MAG: hypothetical protein P4L57_05070 [Rhizomicrobium sp.]|nr:hypothetical protein [Rhizomicrobium sp.]
MTPNWATLAFLFAAALLLVIIGTAFLVLYLIARGRINIYDLLAEPDSTKASLSRFQFLLFTFVIAGLFLLLSVESGGFVIIPDSVLGLLGISAGTYAVSKGITASNKTPATATDSAAAHAAAAAAHASAAAAAAAKAAQTGP